MESKKFSILCTFKHTNILEKLGIKINPDKALNPYCQCRSGSKGSKIIWILADPDPYPVQFPQPCLFLLGIRSLVCSQKRLLPFRIYFVQILPEIIWLSFFISLIWFTIALCLGSWSDTSFCCVAPAPPRDPCNPSPCGANADAAVRGSSCACTCRPEYFGDPYAGCRPECVVNSDCDLTKSCSR